MKTCILLLLMLVAISCETQEEIQSEISTLKNERIQLRLEVQSLESEATSKRKDISSLYEKLKELHLVENGNTPKYILKLHLKQSHFSLDISDHIKDSMNAIDFEIPVDKEFYHHVKVGDKIVEEFRSGSFVLNGKLGEWDMSVQGKEIR